MRVQADARGHPGRAMISPEVRTNQPSGEAAQSRQAVAIVASSSRSARPDSSAWSANAERVTRSAQSDPHHARSSGVAKHHTLADAVTSAKPAACAQARSRRPAAGLAPVRTGDLPVQLHPSVERRRVGVPDGRSDVHVPRGHDAAGPRHTAHLRESRYRIGQMLEDLMGVHDIETVVIEGQRVGVARLEGDVGQAGLRGVRRRGAQHVRFGVDADHPSRRHARARSPA